MASVRPSSSSKTRTPTTTGPSNLSLSKKFINDIHKENINFKSIYSTQGNHFSVYVDLDFALIDKILTKAERMKVEKRKKESSKSPSRHKRHHSTTLTLPDVIDAYKAIMAKNGIET